MAEHEIEIERYTPKGKNNIHYRAVCSCKRWRSEPFRDRENAETKGLAHSVRGDAHNTAVAAMNFGKRVQAKTELEWYRDQANDPSVSESDRIIWQKLADELAERHRGDGTEQDELFSI